MVIGKLFPAVVEVPIPVSAMDVGLPAAFVAIERVALELVAAVGLNVSEIVQVALAARELPQVDVSV